MIIDWSTMEPNIPGEGKDATGFRFGYGYKELDRARGFVAYRVNTVTGQLDCHRWPWRFAEEGGNQGLETITLQLVPPVTVWLYT